MNAESANTTLQRETLDSLTEGVAVFNAHGRIVLFNPSFRRIWGLSDHDFLDSPHISEVITKTQKLHPNIAWTQISRAVLGSRTALKGDMARSDGAIISYALTPLTGGTLLAFNDVTEARRATRAFSERDDALIAADKLKAKFIGHVSDEFRSPLTNIVGFADLLANSLKGDPNNNQEYIDEIITSSQRLLSIVNNILDLTMIDAGMLELKLTRIGTSAIIDKAINAVRADAVRSSLTIEVSVSDNAIEIVADELRLEQVLYYLLSNSVAFSRTGGTVRVTCARIGRPPGEIVFVFDDEGVGIEKAHIEQAFQRFDSRGVGTNRGGAGLGLSIAKGLVELHGGAIGLTSEVGRGTKISVRIPQRLIQV